MKAISLQQPWASLIAAGAKQIETRSWPTSYRGPLAIHASKKLLIPNDQEFIRALEGLGLLDRKLPQGMILGWVNLIDVLPVTSDFVQRWHKKNPRERLFGNYGPDRYAWLLGPFIALDPPVKCRGMQGLFNWGG